MKMDAESTEKSNLEQSQAAFLKWNRKKTHTDPPGKKHEAASILVVNRIA
jgi:hypothetical protein